MSAEQRREQLGQLSEDIDASIGGYNQSKAAVDSGIERIDARIGELGGLEDIIAGLTRALEWGEDMLTKIYADKETIGEIIHDHRRKDTRVNELVATADGITQGTTNTTAEEIVNALRAASTRGEKASEMAVFALTDHHKAESILAGSIGAIQTAIRRFGKLGDELDTTKGTLNFVASYDDEVIAHLTTAKENTETYRSEL